MRKIKVGGVPEHFNLPWHLAAEQGHFSAADIDLEWQFYGGGTGAMTKALRAGEVDMCILLTEGIVADIIKGNPSYIISKYIETPLLWGIHTGINNSLERHEQIYDQQYAISRFGSGSHLMAQVDAFYNETPLQDAQFEVIRNLDGALESLGKLETDVFYWEKFTTKPYVDGGQLKRIGEYPTPWPCFVIAATKEIIARDAQLVKDTLGVIYQMNKEFMAHPEAAKLVSKRFEQQEADVLEWFGSTLWSTSSQVSSAMIEKVIYTLQNAGVLEENQSLPVDQLVKELW